MSIDLNTQRPVQQWVDINDLHPNSQNYNKHPKEQIQLLAADLEEFGQMKPVVVQMQAGKLVIVAGEGLWLAFKHLAQKNRSKWSTIWVTLVPDDWDIAKAEAYLVADNETRNGAVSDKEMLVNILRKQQEEGRKLESLGYTPQSYQDLLGELVQKETREVAEKPEVEFTEELLESHNYVVLYFDNDVDWQHLLSLYPLKTVKALGSRPGFEKRGIGRVVRGIDFLNKIRGVI